MSPSDAKDYLRFKIKINDHNDVFVRIKHTTDEVKYTDWRNLRDLGSKSVYVGTNHGKKKRPSHPGGRQRHKNETDYNTLYYYEKGNR